MITPLEDAVLIEDLEAADEERNQNNAQILIKLFNLYYVGRLGLLDKTPLIYAFRNSPRHCRCNSHSVHLANSLKNFKEQHLPIINYYGVANGIVTAYLLHCKEAETGFKEIDTTFTELDTAEMQAKILQYAYFLVLKPAIRESYEFVIKERPQPMSALDRLLGKIF